MANKHPVDSLSSLYDIMNDFYGTAFGSPAATKEALERARKAVKKDFDAEGEKVAAERSAEDAPVEPEEQTPVEPAVPELPPFDTFWRTADDTVDWTDALVKREPNDGLTDPELWHFYHEQAEKVLQGDLPAYVAVLKKANPLGDLLPYARGFHVKAENADTLSVTFEALPDYMTGTEEENRRYLAGISLRAARDLMALLPVCEAVVHVESYGQTALDVTYTRQEVQKVRFTFVDPVEFCTRCGGKFN